MPGRTLSAYADEETAAKVAEMARLEDRSPAQIAAAALRFYVALPSHGRDAIRAIEAHGGPDALRETAWAASRALIAAEFQRASDSVAAAMTPPADLIDPDEDAILEAAVRLTRRPRP